MRRIRKTLKLYCLRRSFVRLGSASPSLLVVVAAPLPFTLLSPHASPAAAARGGFNSVVVGSHYNSDHSPPSPSSPPSAPRILRERNKVAIHIALQATAWREASMLTSARAPIMTNYPSKLRSLWCADFGVIVILRRTTLCITPRARCCLMPGWPRTHSQHAAGNNERTHYSLPPPPPAAAAAEQTLDKLHSVWSLIARGNIMPLCDVVLLHRHRSLPA